MIRLRLIDISRGTQVGKLYPELIKTSSAEHLAQQQQHNLIGLLSSVKRYCPFYSRLLKDCSVEDIRSFPEKVLLELPIVDKETVNKYREELVTMVPGRSRKPKRTGGSTGTPFHYFVDTEYVTVMWAHIYAAWNRYSGYQPGDPIVTVAGRSLRPVGTAGHLKEVAYRFLQNNEFIRGDVIEPSMKFNQARLREAVLVYGYPSSLAALISANPQFAGRCQSVRAVFTTSEQLTPYFRSVIEESFKVPVFDMYGANDGGLISSECELHDGYHFNMEHCLAEEWQNELGQSELLLTNLVSYSLPFIRYRVGDMGSITCRPCACGRPGQRVVSLRGRARDLLRLPGGGVIHGSMVNKLMFEVKGLAAYRVVQQEDYSLIVRVSVGGLEDFGQVAQRLGLVLDKGLAGLTFRIEQMPLPAATDEKAKLIESHVR